MFFNFKIWRVVFFIFKIWRIVFINSKSDALFLLIQKVRRCIFVQFRIWQVVILLFKNLTPCKNFKSKSDALFSFNSKCDAFYSFQFKIWRVVQIYFKNMTWRKAWKMENLSLSRSKRSKLDLLYANFFKIRHGEEISNSKSDAFFSKKIWQVQKTSFQNLMPCYFPIPN